MKSIYPILLVIVCFLPARSIGATETWALDHSTVTYTVNHPLKTASGISKDAKGKGQCDKGKCQFLIATPVKSFDSGDSNRDLHMLEVTRGGENPMVVVRTDFDERALSKNPVLLNFDIEFAGKKATYRDVPFDMVSKDRGAAQIKGMITIKLSDFSITPPSLLTMSIKDEVPIEIDSFWTNAPK